MQIIVSKTNHHHHSKIIADKPRRGTAFPNGAERRRLPWQPQASGLTRDETRELVLEMIG